jgi:hypothetical protein
MNLKYLTEEILPIREKEIIDGKNLSTKNPIYVVIDLVDNYVSGHSDFSPNTNLKGIPFSLGYIDKYLDSESMQFNEKNTGMQKPFEVSRFYTDRIIAFFLTSQAAYEYLKYQSHNLNNPYVYVFHCGYANEQMEKLLEKL